MWTHTPGKNWDSQFSISITKGTNQLGIQTRLGLDAKSSHLNVSEEPPGMVVAMGDPEWAELSLQTTVLLTSVKWAAELCNHPLWFSVELEELEKEYKSIWKAC